jgi:5-methylcytosine-specific restriction endonuclease McrA
MSKPKTTRPKLATLAPRVGLADLSIAKGRLETTSTSWRSSAERNSSANGYGWKWRQARKGFLQRHPLCHYCEREGRVTAATVVDHHIPHDGDQKLFWDRSNWRACCKAHHDADAQRKDHQFKKQRQEGSGAL